MADNRTIAQIFCPVHVYAYSHQVCILFCFSLIHYSIPPKKSQVIHKTKTDYHSKYPVALFYGLAVTKRRFGGDLAQCPKPWRVMTNHQKVKEIRNHHQMATISDFSLERSQQIRTFVYRNNPVNNFYINVYASTDKHASSQSSSV